VKKYVFFIRLEGDKELRWPGLTLTQARNMYKWTRDSEPQGMLAYGWEEMK
jgi:hypothetical protein